MTHIPNVYDDDCDDDSSWGDEEHYCTHCGGEGYDECDNPMECTYRHHYGLCPCGACGGSGLAKDQTIW